MNAFVSNDDFKGIEDYLGYGESLSAEDRELISAKAKEIYDAISDPSNAKRIAVAMAFYKLAYDGGIDVESDTACDYQDSVVNSF